MQHCLWGSIRVEEMNDGNVTENRTEESDKLFKDNYAVCEVSSW